MANPKISLLLPTRGRLALVQRFFNSVIDTASDLSRIEIILCVDDDDVDSHTIDHEKLRITRIIGPRSSMGAYNSTCYRAATGDIMVLVNDDLIMGTKGWDDKLIALDASIPDGIYLAYGNDLFKKEKLSTFPILSRRTCELLGDPYPTEYRGAFIDYHLFDIFKRVKLAGFDRIRYMDDLIFEHLHFRNGKAPLDSTYGQRGRFADDATFLMMVEARQVAAKRICTALRGGEVGAFVPPPRKVEVIPPTLFQAISTFTRDLLLDRGLPWRWRSFLWVWFIGRYMAGRGMLRPFVR